MTKFIFDTCWLLFCYFTIMGVLTFRPPEIYKEKKLPYLSCQYLQNKKKVHVLVLLAFFSGRVAFYNWQP